MNLRKQRRRQVEPDEIDITSLLDVLVILLVFLLKSFNSSDLTVDLIENLALPYSLSVSLPEHGIVVQTDSNRDVFIDNELLANLSSPSIDSVLIDKLEKLKNSEEFKNKKKDKEKSAEDEKLINLVLDQKLTYEDVDRLLKIVEQAGFNKYKLLTQAKE